MVRFLISVAVTAALIVVLYMETIQFCWCSSSISSEEVSRRMGCQESERQALLNFKQSLTDPSNRLSSWIGQDCCKWKGIGCDNTTGHVVKLDLRNPLPFDDLRFFEEINRYDALYEGSCLVGDEVNPSLLELKHLNYLDLSWNNFSGIKIPKFFDSFHQLTYLNLSCAMFGGIIPHHLGNLSALRSLDLRSAQTLIDDYDYASNIFELNLDNWNWISRLSSLQHLDMSGVKLLLHEASSVDDWAQVINLLPSLLELRLSDCGLEKIPPQTLSSSSVNFTSLAILDLSHNQFQGPIPDALIGNMTSLKVLDLSFNQFNSTSSPTLLDPFRNLQKLETLDLSYNGLNGHLPDWLGQFKNLKSLDLSINQFNSTGPTLLDALRNLSKLETLDLSNNELNGPLPDWLGQFRNLKVLYLYANSFYGVIPTSLGRLSTLIELSFSSNQLNGTIPENLGQLSELEYLDVSYNSLNGVVSEVHFAKLSRLQILSMSFNSLVLKVGSDWVPPFQLKHFSMRSCEIGPHFPQWLQTQNAIAALLISNASISDSMPNWFGNFSSHLFYLFLSDNQIHGNLPIFLQSSSVHKLYLFLSSNKFEGPLPHFPSNVVILDLSNNSISGYIPQNIGDMMPSLRALFLSANRINGSIPISLCIMKSLLVIDLSRNNLSGDLPRCWSNSQKLMVIDLAFNNLSGVIPNSIGRLHSLNSMHLNHNNFSGKLPSTLKNCTSLSILDIGQNRLHGSIPKWIGKGLSSLRILRLRSNMFDGNIPSQLCHLVHLQIMDLANNKLSGTIPTCFGNFPVMVSGQTRDINYIYEDYLSYEDQIMEVIKGRELEYISILSLVINLDLSSNNLVGGIVEELTNLSGLQGLNLSRNHLTGRIPEKIGQLRSLESLDLSINQLSGTIPQSISVLTFLSHMNVSFNNLSGRIPSGYQLQTFNDPSIYRGNPELCGSPLEKKCPGDEPSRPSTTFAHGKGEEKRMGEGSKVNWFYIGMASGFVVGFWGVCGILLFKKTWRHAYFQFVDDMNNRLFITIETRIAWIKKKLKVQSS